MGLEDRNGFILHHRAMRNETDDKVAVTMIAQTKERFYFVTTGSLLVASAVLPDNISQAISLPRSSSKALTTIWIKSGR